MKENALQCSIHGNFCLCLDLKTRILKGRRGNQWACLQHGPQMKILLIAYHRETVTISQMLTDIFPNKQGKLRWAAPLVRQETPPSQSWQEQTLINTDLSQGNIRKPATVGKALANCMSGLSGDPSNTTLVLQFFPLPVSTLLANWPAVSASDLPSSHFSGQTGTNISTLPARIAFHSVVKCQAAESPAGPDTLTLKSLGNTSAGWPRTTNRREFSFLKLVSRSSRDCSRNLQNPQRPC